LLSVEHLYFHAVQRTVGGHPKDGVSLEKILESLRDDGQTAEEVWPYLDNIPDDLSKWRPPANTTPLFKRDSVIAVAAILEIMNYLNDGLPVVITFMVSLAFCEPQDGVVMIRINDADVGWHAVTVVGHAESEGRSLLLVRNSWGKSWGLNGYAWVDVNYLATRMENFATISPGRNRHEDDPS
jgi:hypothetical protein